MTTISGALTQAELLGSEASSERFILAVCIGYEVTCRIGRELGFEAYDRGFHNTGTAGIFGSVAALAVLRQLPAEMIEMAFGLAGSKAAGSMQYLDNGSWNKRLHPGFAVHDAFMCVSLAEAGVVGATKIIEGKMGFLQAYSPKQDKSLDRIVADLDKEWVWLSSSLKPYPACRMTHTFIEMAGNFRASRRTDVDDVASIKLKMSQSSYLLVGQPTPNKVHPMNNIDAQFSVYFQVANALLHGSDTGIQAYQRLQDQQITSLCDRITVQADTSMKGFSGVMAITWASGEVDTAQMDFPLGETQHPFTRDKVEAKFQSLAVPVFGETKASKILRLVDGLEKGSIEELLLLLQ